MAGTLYGIGVGPGDPELMTMKAIRKIQECQVIAVPGKEKEKSIAYQIALGAVPELSKKECVAIEMPMTKDAALLQKSHRQGAETLIELLETKGNVAFLTLGDPTVYSTYMYLHHMVEAADYKTELISGVPSFCAAAARLGISLGEKAEEIHIIPSSYEVEEAVKLPGTKIFMKAGSKIGYLKEVLQHTEGEIYMAERCTMPDEKLFWGAEQINTNAGYYSLVIMKEKN